MAVGVVPAYRSPIIADLFAAQRFTAGVLPNLATAANPADGFSPTRLSNNTEVLFIPQAKLLGSQLAAVMEPLWENGLGLVLYRNADAQVLGAIFLHGAVLNEWNAIQRGAYQCLGGVMLFSDDPRENKDETTLIADVVRKSTAMTTKWMFIEGNLASIGHPHLSDLGGGKSTASHPRGEKGRKDAVRITASVARELGMYISGSDQNMTAALCTYFAGEAPFNFMGAKDHIFPTYGGMGDPSPLTARGVFEALKTARRRHHGDNRVPILFQGNGNVGNPVLRFAREDGHPVAGIIDVLLDKLVSERTLDGNVPLFLQVGDGAVSDDIRSQAEKSRIRLVRDLAEAISLAEGAEIFSPNAGPHPLTMKVADAIAESRIRSVVGAANNVFDMVDGSIAQIADRLLKAGVFVPNDSETNMMGALSVIVQRIDMTQEALIRAAIAVGSLTELSYEAQQRGEAPQIARDREAKRRFNRLVRDGRAVGGPFPGVDDEITAAV